MHIKFVKLIIIPAGSRYLYALRTTQFAGPNGGLGKKSAVIATMARANGRRRGCLRLVRAQLPGVFEWTQSRRVRMTCFRLGLVQMCDSVVKVPSGS
jgi:hypothetical protein